MTLEDLILDLTERLSKEQDVYFTIDVGNTRVPLQLSNIHSDGEIVLEFDGWL